MQDHEHYPNLQSESWVSSLIALITLIVTTV